jgi:hypothetical protein
VIIAEGKVIAVLPRHLCLYVSHGISGISINKHSGRSGVISVLLRVGELAIVNVDTVEFPDIISAASLQVLIPM